MTSVDMSGCKISVYNPGQPYTRHLSYWEKVQERMDLQLSRLIWVYPIRNLKDRIFSLLQQICRCLHWGHWGYNNRNVRQLIPCHKNKSSQWHHAVTPRRNEKVWAFWVELIFWLLVAYTWGSSLNMLRFIKGVLLNALITILSIHLFIQQVNFWAMQKIK